MNAAPIIIPAIDENGSLYPVEKMQAHVEGLFHLAVSIFIFDGDALLTQRRAASKYHCPGQWANTCCTHPHWEESLADCAHRRLKEELGFSAPLEERRIVEYSADVGNKLHEHEKVTMFVAEVNRNTINILPNEDEVDAVRWVTADELRKEMNADPHSYTPWFRIYMQRFPNFSI